MNVCGPEPIMVWISVTGHSQFHTGYELILKAQSSELERLFSPAYTVSDVPSLIGLA